MAKFFTVDGDQFDPITEAGLKSFFEHAAHSGEANELGRVYCIHDGMPELVRFASTSEPNFDDDNYKDVTVKMFRTADYEMVGTFGYRIDGNA